jgi:hypothetical protein
LHTGYERIWLHGNDTPPVRGKKIANSPQVTLTVFCSERVCPD